MVMPTTETVARLLGRATTQRNVSISTAIVVAVPLAYAFTLTFGYQGSLLLLLTLGLGVPTAYDDYWPAYDETRKTVVWVIVACGIAAVEFTGFYVIATAPLGLSSFVGSIGAFLLTWTTNLSWLVVRQRSR